MAPRRNALDSVLESLRLFIHPRVAAMLFLGFSAGVPILLIFSTLGLWLNEAGVAKSSITFFSWAALGYSFKFVWAPLVDRLPLPILTKLLGRRRAWMLVSQLAIMSSILLMSSVDPKAGVDSLTIMAYGAVLLGFSSATQDIVIDAYRIESADKNMQSMLSAAYVAGYRIGMLAAGAGGLFLASYFGSTKELYSFSAWSNTYLVMIMVMMVGVVTTLLVKEPNHSRREEQYSTQDYVRFFALFLVVVAAFIATFIFSAELVKTLKSNLTEIFTNKHLAGFIVGAIRLILAITGAYIATRLLIKLKVVNKSMVNNTYISPVKDFFSRYGVSVAVLLLAVIGLYRISDIVLGVVANIFYQDMGFTKIEIATVSKTFGLFMTIAGGFLGGLMAIKWGVFRVLFLGAALSALTNLLFIVLANVGHNITWLYVTITMDNLSAGLASAAFIAFLSSLTNIKFTAVQYAIFSSLMTLLPKIFGGYSGGIVEAFGYSQFFIITTLIGLPILYLVYKVKPYIN
ncbi:MFS transporter [Candidatus Thioglobus sp.]|nr:MFS transporter [Candidatus Thioglobus sp.]